MIWFILILILTVILLASRDNCTEKYIPITGLDPVSTRDKTYMPIDRDLDSYILLKSFDLNDTDKGGFFWWVHQAICVFRLGEITGKRVIILYDDGYYLDPNRPEKSWWNYYFKYPVFGEYEQTLVNKNMFKEITALPLPKSDRMWLYTNHTFQTIMRIRRFDIPNMYRKYIEFTDPVKIHVDQFDVSKKSLSVHFRGTDKFYGYGDNEDMKSNSHPTYNVFVDRVIKECKARGVSNIIAASDEQSFIDHTKEKCKQHGISVLHTSATRSTINTSGWKMPEDTKITSEDHARALQTTRDLSLHRGNMHIPPYTKGLEALTDAWLLSRGTFYIRSLNGNFSSQPPKFNSSIVEI